LFSHTKLLVRNTTWFYHYMTILVWLRALHGLVRDLVNSKLHEVAPKVMSPILLCWPTTSEADAGGRAVEVKPSP
jgi:hypothetical protein